MLDCTAPWVLVCESPPNFRMQVSLPAPSPLCYAAFAEQSSSPALTPIVVSSVSTLCLLFPKHVLLSGILYPPERPRYSHTSLHAVSLQSPNIYRQGHSAAWKLLSGSAVWQVFFHLNFLGVCIMPPLQDVFQATVSEIFCNGTMTCVKGFLCPVRTAAFSPAGQKVGKSQSPLSPPAFSVGIGVWVGSQSQDLMRRQSV